jgi:hypothetical protein
MRYTFVFITHASFSFSTLQLCLSPRTRFSPSSSEQNLGENQTDCDRLRQIYEIIKAAAAE